MTDSSDGFVVNRGIRARGELIEQQLTVKDFLRVRSEVADRLKRVNTRSTTDFTKHAERLMELGYIDTAAVLSIFAPAEPMPITSAEYPEESHDD